MSYTFYIPMESAPIFSDFFERFDELTIEGDETGLNDRFAPNYFYHVYEDYISVRSLEIGLDVTEEPTFSIRIMTASSAPDYRWAIRIAEYFSELYGEKIQGEDSDPLDITAFRARFNDDWISYMETAGPTWLRRMVKSGEYSGPLMLSGTRRPFYFGIQSLQKTDSPDESVFVRNYYNLARSVQYNDEYYAASIMAIENEASDRMEFCVWAPGVNYLFPEVRYLAVVADETIFVPFSLLREFADVTMLDDCHCLAEEVDDDKWNDVVRRAKTLRIDPNNLPQETE